METIKASVDWCGKNYAAYVFDERINAAGIVVTAKTKEVLRERLKDALTFHIEGCIEDGDSIPAWAAQSDFEVELELRTSAILHEALEYTTLAALSRMTGIKHAQLSHYANAVSQPRPEQYERIIDGMHRIGQACMAI